jgi:predicted nucleic acid-binding protein
LTVFVDTSAVYVLLDRADPRHAEVSAGLSELTGRPLLTHSYVVLECTALVERRLGRDLARTLLLDLLAPVQVVYVDESTHHAATSAYLASRATGPSLVDFTSFEVMRSEGISQALALDKHFLDAGFEVLP